MIRRDYHVIDNTGDYWSVEALPTFKQAAEFRGYIKPYINRDVTLKIISTVRPERIVMAPKEKKLPLFANSEF